MVQRRRQLDRGGGGGEVDVGKGGGRELALDFLIELHQALQTIQGGGKNQNSEGREIGLGEGW